MAMAMEAFISMHETVPASAMDVLRFSYSSCCSKETVPSTRVQRARRSLRRQSG